MLIPICKHSENHNAIPFKQINYASCEMYLTKLLQHLKENDNVMKQPNPSLIFKTVSEDWMNIALDNVCLCMLWLVIIFQVYSTLNYYFNTDFTFHSDLFLG